MAAGDKHWRVLLEQKHIERPGDTPPRVGDPIMLLDDAGMPHVAKIAEILPPIDSEAGTLVVKLFSQP
jgi:hypothetical protein